MAQLTSLVDMLLTNVSSGYFPTGYVSEQLLPMVPVVQSTGKLGKYGTNHLRIETSIKGGRGKYRRVETQNRSTTTYAITGHGLEGLVTDEDYRNVLLPFDAERDETIGLSTLLWVGKEKGLADTLTNTGIITNNTTLSGTAQFNDYENSSPLDKSAAARAAVRAACGMPPDTVVMDWVVFDTLRFHPQILDALGYKFARPGGVTGEELASALNVQRVLIAQAMYESAAEGATSSLAACWGKHIVFCVAPTTANPMQTSVGYYLKYADRQPRQIYKFPSENPPNATKLLCEDSYDYLISNAGAAYLIADAIA